MAQKVTARPASLDVALETEAVRTGGWPHALCPKPATLRDNNKFD